MCIARAPKPLRLLAFGVASATAPKQNLCLGAAGAQTLTFCNVWRGPGYGLLGKHTFGRAGTGASAKPICFVAFGVASATAS